MHNYISKCSKQQPPATVKRMAPAPEQMDPRLIEQMMRDIHQQQMPAMSNSDAVNITISIAPPQQGMSSRFNGSALDRELDQQMMDTADSIERGEYVRQRSQDLLSRTLNSAYDIH